MNDPRAYVYMADVLRGQIREGAYEPGERIMSITSMAGQFGHARPTCAHALHVLESEGLVFRVPGKGYYVSKFGGHRDMTTDQELRTEHFDKETRAAILKLIERFPSAEEEILEMADLAKHNGADNATNGYGYPVNLCPLRTAPNADASYPRDG